MPLNGAASLRRTGAGRRSARPLRARSPAAAAAGCCSRADATSARRRPRRRRRARPATDIASATPRTSAARDRPASAAASPRRRGCGTGRRSCATAASRPFLRYQASSRWRNQRRRAGKGVSSGRSRRGTTDSLAAAAAFDGRCISALGVARRLNIPIFALLAPGSPGASPVSVHAALPPRASSLRRLTRIGPAACTRYDSSAAWFRYRDPGALLRHPAGGGAVLSRLQLPRSRRQHARLGRLDGAVDLQHRKRSSWASSRWPWPARSRPRCRAPVSGELLSASTALALASAGLGSVNAFLHPLPESAPH